MPAVACPNCSAQTKVADDLDADARVRCEQCGKRFAPALPTPTGDEPLELDDCEATPTARRSRVFLLAACVGSALLLAGVAVAWLTSRPAKRDEPPVAAAPAEPTSTPKKNPDPPAPAGPRVPPGDGEKLTAPALIARYRGDLGRGAARYDGAALTVSGKLVNAAERRADGEVVVGLAGPDDLRVWCRLGPKADPAGLPDGAGVTVRGRCVGSGFSHGAAHGFRRAADVILTDCVLVGEPTVPPPPTLPTPEGVDYPKGVAHHGIEVRVTAAHVGHPVLVLGGGGPNAGATAKTAEKYLILRMQVRNARKVDFMASYVYAPPDGSQVRLTDEAGNRFAWCRTDAAPEPGSVVAQELAADPKRRLWFRDESTRLILDPGEAETYLLVFAADHLGKGTRLFLSLPNRVFGELKYDQVIRFEQAAVEPLPADPVVPPSEAKPPATAGPGGDKPVPAADPATDAKVAALVTQLAKGKTVTDRIKAADELSGLGAKAKAATGPLCQALFDPATKVRLAALDALKGVNPAVHRPVVALVSPLDEFDFVGLGPRDRLPHGAVAALAKLGAEGKAAVPVLIFYKREISRQGGWPYVPEVVDALAALAPDDPAVAAVLVQGLLKDADPASRFAAAKGLAGTPARKESVAALTTAVRTDPEAEVRVAAVGALAKFGADAKAALKVLEAAKSDPDARVREAARDALDKIK